MWAVWLKVKRILDIDVVWGAVIGPILRPQGVVAGLPVGGRFRIVGRPSPLRTADSVSLARWLRPPAGEHPWPARVKGSILDRFNGRPLRFLRVSAPRHVPMSPPKLKAGPLARRMTTRASLLPIAVTASESSSAI